jgi:hypothetical protein
MEIEMPMHKELSKFIDQYGLCGVLEILTVIAGERAEQNHTLKNKWEKAQTKFWQLSQTKFVQPL